MSTFVGNKVNYTGLRCPNVAPKSNFYQYQGYIPKATNGTLYNQAWCTNMRSSVDTKSYVSGYEIGTSIKFKAGYKIYTSVTGAAIAGGKSDDWLTYTMIESAENGACGPLSMMMAATAVVSLLF